MSTSKLQKYVSQQLSVHFGQFHIKENYRPEWLSYDGARLELDFYIEEIQVAIEVQGGQHYTYVPHFHGSYEGFCKGLSRDYFKRSVCSQRLIKLYEFDNEVDAKLAIQDMYQYIPEDKFIPDRIVNIHEPIELIEKREKAQAKKVKPSKKQIKSNFVEKALSSINLDALNYHIGYINYLIISKRGMAEHDEYKRYLRQKRGHLKALRNIATKTNEVSALSAFKELLNTYQKV